MYRKYIVNVCGLDLIVSGEGLFTGFCIDSYEL
jgi:hypothetical protein